MENWNRESCFIKRFSLHLLLICHLCQALLRKSNPYVVDAFSQLAFVITDGNQTTTGTYTRLSEASQGIKNKGVTVYALGVGREVHRAVLDEIASRSDYVSITPSFQDLLSFSSGIRQLFCAGECFHTRHEYTREILIQKGERCLSFTFGTSV